MGLFRTLIILTLTIGIRGSLFSFSLDSGKLNTDNPNIIIILTDDMGFGDISSFGGGGFSTPNIDKLADRGLILRQYYSAAPICSPSRAGIFTGMYPADVGFTTFLSDRNHNRKAEQVDFLDPEAPSMARIFKDAGYVTGHFGKWHMGGGRDVDDAPAFRNYGFDTHISTYESPEPDPLLTATDWIWSDQDSIKRWDRTNYFVDKALEFLESNPDKPCFLNVWPDDVHTPWIPRETIEGDSIKPESEKAFRLVLDEYDKQIGRLIEGLERLGIIENTIVIFTSDNGALPTFNAERSGGFRGSKLSLYEGGTRMPFIISWPEHITPNTIDSTSEVHATDLLPSLAALSGISLSDNYEGVGLNRSEVFLGMPSLRNKEMYWEYGRNEEVFRYPPEYDRSPSLAVRSGSWKFLMDSNGDNQELYNIVLDEKEEQNVIEDHLEIAAELKKKLTEWWGSLPKAE